MPSFLCIPVTCILVCQDLNTEKQHIKKVTLIITGQLESSQNHSQNIWTAYNAQQQGTTENSHTGHSTHTLKSADVKAQNVYHGKTELRVPFIVTTIQLQHYIHQEHGLYELYYCKYPADRSYEILQLYYNIKYKI